MAKKTLTKCRSGKDFIRYAERQGAEVKPGSGSHHKVKTERGMCIVPVHSKDLANGTRAAIIKTFVQIGILVLVACAILRITMGA